MGLDNKFCCLHKKYQEKIPVVGKIKHLGIHIQDDLKWSIHIDFICSKASSTLGFTRHTIPSQLKHLCAKVCKQLIRPVLEYASCSWDQMGNCPHCLQYPMYQPDINNYQPLACCASSTGDSVGKKRA